MLRDALLSDVPAMLAIYAPYVTDTAITFEYEPPTEAEFAARFTRITADHPWLVLEEEGRVLGYAYAARAFEKAAYAWCADVTIYLSPEAVGQGRGRLLYEALEARLRAGGWQVLYALVTASNEHSLRFHRAFGYREIGRLPASGWKQGQWHDVIWLEKRLAFAVPTKKPGT